MDNTIKIVRAAVYVRKSSEEGLELEYNSLDAQTDACKAYIQSQKHEGWVLVEKTYSDGGISGGTLNRPALQELLKDIEDGLVDIIVVYKIDRLTRSLHDFSKLVEVFDKYQTSFVSITQQFNTSTSMGRLTLNMLLSFAQFEREVTGERIRDKKKAMAMKGMWGSGVTPFGYDKIDKKLFPNKDQSNQVREMFRLYIELGSVNLLRKELREKNIRTQNGRDWSDGNLYNILRRKLYIGKIEHHGEVYEGQHEAIVEKDIFRKAQQILDINKRRSASKVRGTHNSLLADKIFDSEGYVMSPSHSAKKGATPRMAECRGVYGCTKATRRYRYYISQAYLRKEKDKAGNLPQVPAVSIEELVVIEIKIQLKSQLPLMDGRLDQQKAYEKNWNIFIESEWYHLNPKVFILIRQTLQKLVVNNRGVEFTLDRENLQIIAEAIFRNNSLPEELPNSENIISYTKLCKLEQVRHGKSFIIEGQNHRNTSLVNALKQAWEWNDWIAEGKYKWAKDIARALDYDTPRRVENVMRLRYLSPKIQLMILKGTQPKGWTTRHLFSYKSTNWTKQEKELGL